MNKNYSKNSAYEDEIIEISNSSEKDKKVKVSSKKKKKTKVNKKNNKKGKKINKNKLVTIIVMVIALGIMGVAGFHIVRYSIDSPKTKELGNKLQEDANITEVPDNENQEVIPSNEKPNTPYWNFIKMNLIDVDFTALKETNSDTVGWLWVGGTNVNYPVVQTKDNDYYLTHSFDKTNNAAGWVFMDYRNDKNSYGRNTIIYGHNRKDQTMFGTLKRTLNKSWYNTEENRVIKMSTESYNTLWQIYSIYTIDTTSDYIQTNFVDDNDYQRFIDLVKGRSYTNFNTNVTTSDKTLTLSTCHGSSKKLVVHAKLIKIEAK